jgi:predicted amidohydrolase YtcJ
MGVTTFGDVNARGLDRMQAYFDAARNNRMTIRGYILNTIEYYAELAGRPDAIDKMKYEDAYLHFGGYKFLLDGAVIAMNTHAPHNGIAWNVATWNPNQLKEAVKTLHGAGYQCSFHVIGDAAVDRALDAIEFAMNASPRADPRHRLEHAVLCTDAALKRMKDLGVVVSTQPQAIRLLGDYLREMLGEERAQRIIPTRAWLDLGVPLSLSSDAPTLPWYQPPITLAGALLRVSATNQVFGPEHRLTIKEAMCAHTMGGAHALFEEKTKGSLEPSKLADLIVWHQDPYATPPQNMTDLTIDLTMVGGKVVHEV